jgi:hypothetical protein
MVNECNAKLCKVYMPEDDSPLEDRRMWPFYGAHSNSKRSSRSEKC